MRSLEANGPRLVLIAPDPTDALALRVSAACAAADIAAIVVPLAAGPEKEKIAHARALASAAQEHGTALLLEGAPELATLSGADGVHLTGAAAVASARARLVGHIVGAGGLSTRHDAMLAGEAGADYVMFGEPDPRGRRPGPAALIERVGWWAEIFQIPCVAYAAVLDEIPPLVAAGADFIALAPAIWATDGAGVSAAARLLSAEPVA